MGFGFAFTATGRDDGGEDLIWIRLAKLEKNRLSAVSGHVDCAHDCTMSGSQETE
jgi:hypothetical protein